MKLRIGSPPQGDEIHKPTSGATTSPAELSNFALTSPGTTPQPLALHNPALLPPQILLAEFTARRPLLHSLVDSIRHNTHSKPLQHPLLIGARGMGKTTTLWAVAYTVQADSELSRRWLPVVFDEESRRVGDLADFWLEALRQWEHAAKDPEHRAHRLLDEPVPDLEEAARKAFLEKVDRSGRRALLLIDNLSLLLASIHDPEPLERLRAFLAEDSRVMVLGTATRHFEQMPEIDQAFHDFFRVFDLHPLTLEEMKASLLALANARGDKAIHKILEERSGTVRSLHLLTGGNPRLIKTFYRLLTEGLRGDIRTDLERLLDEFTPYFKAVADALPVQQQRIFDAVALAWDPVEVAAIARVTRLPSNQVSAQLRALVKAGLVAEAAGHPKRKTYLLADRFSNIHYLMRHGRAARNRFDWFVALVRLVFPDSQAETLARLARQTAEAGPEGLRDARDLFHSALARADCDDSRQEILHAALEETWNSEALSQLCNWLDLEEAKRHLPEIEVVAFFSRMPLELRRRLRYAPNDSAWWLDLGRVLNEEKAFRLGAAAYRKAIELDPNHAPAWSGLGIALKSLGENTEAEAAYRKAIELDPHYAKPWNNLGNVLKEWHRPAEAESAYHKAIELDPEYAKPWYNLANLLADSDRAPEAESAYRKAIELDPHYAKPWNNLGNLLKESNRAAEAEAAYRKAIGLDPRYAAPWNNLGSLLKELDRPTEAEAAYRKAIELDPQYAMPWSNLGNLLRESDRATEAEAAYRKAIDLDLNNARSWYNLANLLMESDRITEAEAAYRKAIGIDPRRVYAWAGLANVLARQPGGLTEARACAATALKQNPASGFARQTFARLCREEPEAWQAILPELVSWCAKRPSQAQAFDFTVDGFLQYARLTRPAAALALLESLPDSSPFETLTDAFRAHGHPDHLSRLAPERRAIVLELLSRFGG